MRQFLRTKLKIKKKREKRCNDELCNTIDSATMGGVFIIASFFNFLLFFFGIKGIFLQNNIILLTILLVNNVFKLFRKLISRVF